MAIHQQANLTVTLNNEQAKRELEELQVEMKRLIDLRDKAQKAGDLKAYQGFDNQLKKATRQARSYERQLFDVNKAMRDLSGASLNDLLQAKRVLTWQTAELGRETAQYAQKAQQLKLVNAEISRINAATRATSGTFARLGDAFNRYFSLFTAVAASLAGVSLAVRGAVNAYSEFEDRLADVMKTTGLTREEVGRLNEELKKIDTRSSQEELLNLGRIAGKLGITDAREILGFVRATDQIGVALKEDLGGNVEDAVRELGKLVDIFQLKDEYGMEQSLLKVGSAINELGMASTANEAYLVSFAKRTAGIAPIAGVSIQNILGLAATLDSLGQTSEVSSTAYSKLMTTMSKKTAEFAAIARMDLLEFSRMLREDANEAMIRVFEGLKGNSAGLEALVSSLGEIGLEGARVTSVFGALANNTHILRNQQKLSNDAFREGISLTQEFGVKNNTAQAQIDKARKKFAEVRIELGEKLQPAYASIISKARLMLNGISAVIDILEKYGKAMVVAGSAIAAYTVAIHAKTIGMKAYQVATAAATVTTRGFNAVIRANPIGLLVSLLTAAATAFILYRDKARGSRQEQDELNESIARGNQLLASGQSLKERSQMVKSMSRGQLEALKGDMEGQLRMEEDYHVALLQQLKKRLEQDLRLKELYQARSHQGLSRMQQVNLDARIHARQKELAMELEEAGGANRKRMAMLKSHLDGVNREMENRPLDTDLTPVAVDPQALKKALEDSLKALDGAHQQRLLLIEQQGVKERKNQEWLNLEKAVAERTYLEQKLAMLRQAGESGFEVQRELIGRELELIRHTDQEILRLREQHALDFQQWLDQKLQVEEDALGQSIRANIEYAQKVKKTGQDLSRAQREEMADRADALLHFTQTLGDSFQEFLVNREESFEDFLRKTLVQTLDFLERLMVAAIAQQTIRSIMEGAPLNPVAVAKAVANTLMLKAAFGLAKAAIQQGDNPGGDKGYARGGYTGSGDRDEPAGIVHRGEWVAPKSMVESPVTGPVITALEVLRRNAQRLPMAPVLPLAVSGYARGGMVAGAAVAKDSGVIRQEGPDSVDHRLLQRMAESLERNNQLLEKLQQWKPRVYTELIKKDLDTLEQIQRTRGM